MKSTTAHWDGHAVPHELRSPERGAVEHNKTGKGLEKMRSRMIPSFVVATVMLTAGEAASTTLQAKSCSFADVKTKADAATNGDTVIIPKGICTWTSSLNITNKSVSFVGAGKTETVITKTNAGQTFSLSPRSTLFRISDMTIDGNRGVASGILIEDNSVGTQPLSFRINNILFSETYRSFEVRGYTKAVVDHCEFIDPYCTAVRVFSDCGGSWSRRPDYGGDEGLFIEDCLFRANKDSYDSDHKINGTGTLNHWTTANSGSVYTIRHSVFDTDYEAGNLFIGDTFDQHGFCYEGENCSGVPRHGGYMFNFYENTYTTEHVYRVFYIRGGKGVIYGNSFSGDLNQGINIIEERTTKADCGQEADGTCASTGGYPCTEQIGSDGAYHIWNNGTIPVKNLSPTYIHLNRDYFLSAPPGYVEYTYPHPLTLSNDKPLPPTNVAVH